MPQVNVYGLKEHLNPIKSQLSEIIHESFIVALNYPAEKKCQRFFPMQADDFYYPTNASPRYTLVEIQMFEGRSVEVRKQILRLIMERVQQELDFAPEDFEVILNESPRCNWGIRGTPADELQLNYKVET